MENLKWVRVKTLQNDGGSCPSQWSGKTEDDKDIYIRYRWGKLSVLVDDECVFTEFVGHNMSGGLTTKLMLKHTQLTMLSACSECDEDDGCDE